MDVLTKLIAKEAGLRAMACETTGLSKEGAGRHKASRTATDAIAQGLTGAALMGGVLLKIKQRLAIKFDGDGALGKMIVESDSYGRVRGYVEHGSAEHPHNDVAQLIGSGALIVSKDIGLREAITSSVSLSGGAIGDDLGVYLEQSEQIPAAIEIGTRFDGDELIMSGGIVIQAMPGYDETTVERFKNRLQEMPPIADVLLGGASPEQILADLFHDTPHDILEHRDLSFVCGCSYTRSEQAIIALGVEAVDELIAEGQAVVDCHFCHQQFVFTKGDLLEIRAMM